MWYDNGEIRTQEADMGYLEAMKRNLSEDARAHLARIYAPTPVGVPPADPCRGMLATEEGEIRIYGACEKKDHFDPGIPYYLSSRDCGMSFETVYTHGEVLGPAGYDGEGRYVSIYPVRYGHEQDGAWVYLSDKGYDSTEYRAVRLSEEPRHILKIPCYIASLRRWFVLGEHRYPNGDKYPFVYTSDDRGESWCEHRLTPAPRHEVRPPHKGVRWQEGSCEPTMAQLGDGRLMILCRTSQDNHYQYFSEDGGDSWSDPAPSPFHGTITMPVLRNLSDGRILLFWCNTRPMPELDHDAAFPPPDEDERSGFWEEVFTNRDANHLAISEDGGKSFFGWRELWLNPLRCHADFRAIGGSSDTLDKSVHQAEILELPDNKVLIGFGQNGMVRKLVILDLAWLSERGRHEDFKFGLGGLSTQMYLKSNLGGYRGFSGHCAYNRTDGALLVPDPAGNFREVLQLCRTEDPRLVYPRQGAVWNFPASRAGEVTLEVMRLGSGIRLSLLDFWMNPMDEEVEREGFCSFALDDVCLTPNIWHTVTLRYSTEQGTVLLLADGEEVARTVSQKRIPHGLSYLHIQTLADARDYEGTLIRSLDARDTESVP